MVQRRAEHGALQLERLGRQPVLHYARGQRVSGWQLCRVSAWVLGGLDTVDVIASVPTDSNDKPRTEQVMRTVYVETYGKTYTFTMLED